MLKLLHTADWYIGRTFGSFTSLHDDKLRSARLTAVENIFNLADRYNVDAVLCAGNLFDEPNPDEDTWSAVQNILRNTASAERPIVLLPGSHDPLVTDSVYELRHDFRSRLPDYVHVVDDKNFELPIKDGVLYSAPCRSHTSDIDMALQLPKRTEGDSRIRIALVHGSPATTAENVNHPISTQAASARGFDYIASGSATDWHEIAEDDAAPLVYPGTPEPSGFNEDSSGSVALVTFRRSGSSANVSKEQVGSWVWRDESITSLNQLIELGRENLSSTALRLNLNLTVDMQNIDKMENAIEALAGNEKTIGKAGAFICNRSLLQVNVTDWSIEDLDLPDTVSATINHLKEETASPEKAKAELAQHSLLILQKMLDEKGVLK